MTPDQLGKEATLTLGEGSVARVLSTGMLECYCESCKEAFWVRSNKVWVCPCCAKPGITCRWTTPQVVLVPQDTMREKEPNQSSE